jgi:hypothetical protein
MLSVLYSDVQFVKHMDAFLASWHVWVFLSHMILMCILQIVMQLAELLTLVT